MPQWGCEEIGRLAPKVHTVYFESCGHWWAGGGVGEGAGRMCQLLWLPTHTMEPPSPPPHPPTQPLPRRLYIEQPEPFNRLVADFALQGFPGVSAVMRVP